MSLVFRNALMPSENKQILRLQQLDLMNKSSQSLMNDWSILIKKQFILIARTKMISNEEAWNLFLSQPSAKEIHEDMFNKIKSKPVLKELLLGEIIPSIDEALLRLKIKGRCDLLPVLEEMSDEPLLPEFVSITNSLLEMAIAS